MKFSLAALSILMVMAFSSPASSVPMGPNSPTLCCFVYANHQIPRSYLKDYYVTSSLCSHPAVVFQTKKGKQVCANPDKEWVQKYMNDPELNRGDQGYE